MNIEQLIYEIQKRPKMFVKEERIEYIYYLLSGYCAASNKSSDDDVDKKFCCWFGKWLRTWIEDNIDDEYISKTAYWYDDVKAIDKNEQKEVIVFFDLCHHFFNDYSNGTGYFSWKHD